MYVLENFPPSGMIPGAMLYVRVSFKLHRHATQCPQGVSLVLKSILIRNAAVGCVWKYSVWVGNLRFSRTSRSGDKCH